MCSNQDSAAPPPPSQPHLRPSIYTLQSPYGQRLIDADLVQRGQVLGFLQSRQTLLFLPLLLAGVELVEAVAYDWNGQGDH